MASKILIVMNFKMVLVANRLALFVVYFWFGLLKVIGVSPATGLVTDLAHVTLPFFEANKFIVLFGIFECLVGLMWLWPNLTKIVFWLTVFHLIATFLPTIFLPEIAWNQFLTPSLVGQYIIKNLVILSSIFTLYFASNYSKEKLIF